MSSRAGFKEHGRSLGENLYVYAVLSRRARGLSVGVNMNPDKVCNFDCPYCQVDRTLPGGPSEVDVERLSGELGDVLDRAVTGSLFAHAPFDAVDEPLRRVADIAFAGDGEPTSPKAFADAARRAREERDRRGLTVPLRLLTNATLLDRPRVREGLVHFDELWCKLDAGTDEFFHFADGTRLPFARILGNLLAVARERPIVIQSLFFAHGETQPDDAEIAAYVGRLRDIVEKGGTIDRVQVNTVARRPSDPEVGPLSDGRLQAIAERVAALGLRAEVHGSS